MGSAWSFRSAWPASRLGLSMQKAQPFIADSPPRRGATGWADEARRPPQPHEIVQTVCVRLKPGMELTQGPGVLGACAGIGMEHVSVID
jgi:hypothetical protein